MKYKTEQEEFWCGNFGNDYITRNYDEQIIAGNVNLFSQILSFTNKISSLLEFGANVGQNLIALKQLLPKSKFTAVEINKLACDSLRKFDWLTTINKSIIDFVPKKQTDFVLTKGLLIHINPNELQNVYKTLYNTSSKYICIVEYYNPTPIEINYRGHKERLFKRDFAGEIMKRFCDLKLLKYGFSYHLDNNFPQDDLNWFLLEK
jgi:spore coat polysaccharide biosynthesis protein SpsF